MSWVRLKTGNDWGCVYFAIEPLEGGMANARRGIKVSDGEVVDVRWGNGECSSAKIFNEKTRTTIHDHGHSYEVTSIEPHVVMNFCGTEVRVRIDKVDVPLDWALAHGAR